MQADLAADQQAFNLEKLILEYSLMRANDSASMVFSQQLAAYVEELKDAQEEENLEALRQAGLIVSYTLVVENQGGARIDSAAVSIGGNNPVARRDLSTSGGEVVIADLPVGSSPFTITATGYVGVAFIVDFGQINGGADANNDEFVVVGDRIYPIGRNETSRITLVSVSNGTTATVSGVATIETDVTNLTPEVPQNVTIVAYLDGTANPFAGNATASSPSIYDFRFIGEGIGTAVVDNTTGAWSMVLPATEGGINYSFIVPDITANQTIAIDERNEVAIAPEYAVVPTRFGPSISTAQTVSAVSGARAVFTAPPAQGTGFGLTFTQVARGLDAGANTGTGANNTFVNTADVTVGADVYRMASRGSALSTSPTGTAAGGNGTGTNATFATAIFGRITSMTISAAGTNYAANQTITLRVTPQNSATPAGNTATDIENNGTGVGNNTFIDFITTITAVGGGGEITALALPTGANIVGITSDAYFGTGVTQYNVAIQAYGGVGTGATFTPVVNASVNSFTVTSGSAYTGVPTSITFTGGGGFGGTPVLPTLSLVAMSFDYTVAASGGTGYAVLPGMQITRTTTFGGTLVTNGNINTIDGGVTATPTLISNFTLVSGVPTLKNTQLAYRTGRTFTTPVAVITPDPSTTAVATVGVNGTVGSATFSQVNALNFVLAGSGYAAPFAVTIEPSIATAPGSGATVSFTVGDFTFNAATGEYTWNGGNSGIVGGSGYLSNLNRSGTVGFSGNNNLSVVSGATYTRNIVFGTGVRLQNVD